MRILPLLLVGAALVGAQDHSNDIGTQAVAVLKKNCVACHGAGLKASNLDLRTRDAIIAGGERGAAMVPNYPEKSRLYVFATHEQNPAMPPGSKLPDGDLDVLKRWILAGSPWPAAVQTQTADDAKAALKAMEERPITEKERQFWAFRPVARPAVPAGASNPVDAFLRATYKEKGLKPAPQASARTLVRRAYLDLLGLPPTPEQVNEFLSDKSPDAWSRLVDRLLQSPHYGERWARYWLDLVRYADSGGFEYDNDRRESWRYRDYVVSAFNNDKPYDRFLREQIAGDELDKVTPETLIATGFLRLGPENNLKNEMTRMDELDDLVQTTSLSTMAMTMGCARCHNHKFDPIAQKDYYAMQAVFFSTKAKDYPLASADQQQAHKDMLARLKAESDPVKKRKAEIEKPYHDRLFEAKVNELAPYMQEAWRTPADKRTEGQRLNARQIQNTLKVEEAEIVAQMNEAEKKEHASLVVLLKDIESRRPDPLPAAMAIGEHGRDPLPSYFLHRGSPDNKGSLMEPGTLMVATLSRPARIDPPEGATTSYRRRNFAEWVASAENPLTARVMVNRIWQRHFGEGIVSTPSNFGVKGERPTNPQLLDWLASEFVAKGWSMKAMHRLMMNSEAYRMSSDDIEANRKIDSANQFVWRQGRPRLDIETMRDGMLAVSGVLDAKVGGPAMHPYIDPSLFQESSRRTWPGKADSDPSTWRRSIYVFAKRTIRYPMFESFDQPDMITSCARRSSSITAPQALLLMNNPAVRLYAEKFAARLQSEAPGDASAQVKRGFELALSRPPTAAELSQSIDYVKSGPNGLFDFCHGLMNLNEFVFMP